MKPPSARLFKDSASVVRRTWSTDASYGKVPVDGTPVVLACLYQPLDSSEAPTSKRSGAAVDGKVLFPADPLVNAEDLITVGGVVLEADGPAIDQGGQGALWIVPVVRRA